MRRTLHKPSKRSGYQPREVPLARAISKLGLASRAEAVRHILAGDVTVDGRPARDPGVAVVPETAVIRIRGSRARVQPPCTVMLHKPRGVVTTRSDPGGRPTVYDLIRDVGQFVGPVGRLDLASTGLLLLTNDTRFADWVLDPANEVTREYIVTVRGELLDERLLLLRRGMRAGDDLLSVRRITVLKRSARETHLRIVLTEGKNRELRRLLHAVGHEVTRLTRVSLGGLTLGDLAPGAWRRVAPDELRKAFPHAPLKGQNDTSIKPTR